MDLTDQVVVITGGSEGLGKAVAKKLSKEGAKIVLIARNEERLKVVKEELEKDTEVEIFVCDVSDHNAVRKTFKEIEDKFGTVDVLVNNAGIWYEGIVEDHPAEKIKELFMINSVAPIYTVQSVLPIMKAKKSGQIFNVSSIAGVVAEPGWPVYVGTKYALRGFTDALEVELKGTGIRVMGFYPGGMNTQLFTKAGFPANNEPWMMDIEKVADIVLFMLKQPKEITIDHIVLKSMNDYLIFEE